MLNSNEPDGNVYVDKHLCICSDLSCIFFFLTLQLHTKAICFEFFPFKILESEIAGVILVTFLGEYGYRNVITAVA